ncbi:MAG TPA: DUF3817 domain-containing protein [Chitinophagaceae bacterium]|jgi:integral membrane protein|nr:DUF3817 domain-containing protein [Chitinophagaceae bacterium]
MSFNLSHPIGRLRLLGLLEGVSLLVLLFIAMPLKYAAGRPEMVRYVGWAHGLLFVLFMGAALTAYLGRNWPFKKLVLAFLAAFVPFGTFWFDRQLKREEE